MYKIYNSFLPNLYYPLDESILRFFDSYEKPCLRGFANNTGADQPVHRRSLTSALVIHLLRSIIPRLDTSETSIFYLVSVAEQAGLSVACQTP